LLPKDRNAHWARDANTHDRSADEPFTLYAGLAKSVDVPDDRSSITFHLDPDAKFSNGINVTPTM